MQCGKHVEKNLPVFTCMENPYDVSTSKVYRFELPKTIKHSHLYNTKRNDDIYLSKLKKTPGETVF